MRRFVVRLAMVGVLAAGAAHSGYAQGYPADNSGKNVRDRHEGAVTADQQSNSEGDVKITQKIRSAVTADKSLSTSAHNIKIITIDGKVTLRGPVASEQEKMNIDAKAKEVAGASHVENRLEIAAQ